jgi:hypothetical protein
MTKAETATYFVVLRSVSHSSSRVSRLLLLHIADDPSAVCSVLGEGVAVSTSPHTATDTRLSLHTPWA